MDFVVIAILGVAVLRGLFRGLVREAVSIGALAAACVAVRFLADPAAEWLLHFSDGEVGPGGAPWLAGIGLALVTLFAAALLARLLRGGAKAAGLGWVDHAGGAALGAAEGVLVSAVLVLVASSFLGRQHPFLDGSRSVAALEQIERAADDDDLLRNVAAPPPPPPES